MKALWRFRIVDEKLQGIYAAEPDGLPTQREGTDEDALATVREFQNRHRDALRVEAVSVGCPSEITDTPGRQLAIVRERLDKRGWNLLGELMTGTWHRSISDAVSYGAFRTRGYISETRIENRYAKTTHVILVDARERYSLVVSGPEVRI